jgi:hypothetical protein
MTFDSGVISHHSARGAYLRTSHSGTATATSQKNGEIAATMAAPKNL